MPPVIALIRDDLALNATQVGLLSSIPCAMFAIAALVGSLLVARLGLIGALVSGLLLVAAGSALRGLSSGYATLVLTTIVMSAGVAIMQPLMPGAVRQWLPDRIGLGTAIYTNGLLAGEVFAVLFTIPLVLPAVDGSWRASFVVWAIPVACVALFVYAFAPRSKASAHGNASWRTSGFPIGTAGSSGAWAGSSAASTRSISAPTRSSPSTSRAPIARTSSARHSLASTSVRSPRHS